MRRNPCDSDQSSATSKLLAAAGEEFLELSRNRIQPRGRFKYSRADARREVLQHAVVIFAGKRDPQQSQWGSCQKQ